MSSNFVKSFFFPISISRNIQKLQKERRFDVIHFIGTSIIASKRLSKLGIPMFATIESYPTLCPKGDRFYRGKEECKFVCSPWKFFRCQLYSGEIGKMKNKWYMRYNPLFLAYVYIYFSRLRRSLNYCTLVSISEYVKKILEMHNKPSVVIPNIVDFSKFNLSRSKIVSTNSKNENSDGNNVNYSNNKEDFPKLRILYLGSLTRYKGPHILLEAIKGLK